MDGGWCMYQVESVLDIQQWAQQLEEGDQTYSELSFTYTDTTQRAKVCIEITENDGRSKKDRVTDDFQTLGDDLCNNPSLGRSMGGRLQ